MNTIIIDEKTVQVDGVKYVREEPQFKVGQWVVVNSIEDYSRNPIGDIGRVYPDNSKDYDCRVIVYGVSEDNIGNGQNYSTLRPATKDEIEQHLIKVAKEKYPNGCKVKSALYGDLFIYNELNIFDYEIKNDQLWLQGMCLYNKGKWAEILPSKKPLPKTKEELNIMLNDFLTNLSGTRNSVLKFLEDYE